jgi:hypothetical protein
LNESFWILNKQTNKIDMKNKLIAVIATLGMVASASAVKVNNNLSINGFIDGSYQMGDQLDGGVGGGGDATKDQALGVDEVELNFITNVGNVDGVLNIDSNDGVTNLDVEQAHITYSLDNGVSFTLGKYGSALGFEREDPTSLYTFSRAYGDSGIAGSAAIFNLGDVDNNVVEGFTVAYSADAYSVAASFENGLNTDAEDDELNLELSFSYTGINNVTLGGGYFFDNRSNTANETDILNLHASTSFGKLFLAVEFTEVDQGGANADLDGYLVLADYDINDKFGAALRVSSNEQDGGTEYQKVTVAPNYAVTESLTAIVEYSDVEDGSLGAGNEDVNSFALELLYTF